MGGDGKKVSELGETYLFNPAATCLGSLSPVAPVTSAMISLECALDSSLVSGWGD